MSKRSLVMVVVTVASTLLIGEAYAGATMIHSSPRAQKVAQAEAKRATSATHGLMNRQQWVGARAIIFDQSTRSLRKPTASETVAMVQTLQRLTSKPARRFSPSVQSIGGRQGSIEGDQANVVIARATADGQVETRCVQTFEEAAEFLGLVQQNPAAGVK
jgi:hypothetical protein